MLSNIFSRLLPTVRPIHNYKQHFLRLLSTAEPITKMDNSNSREKGTVKRFSKEKGYGFISKNDDGTDYFVHFKNINATGFKHLEQGQEVEFTVAQGEKGLEAKDVNVTSSETSPRQFSERRSNDRFNSSRGGFGSMGNQSSSLFEFDAGQNSRSENRSFNFGRNNQQSREIGSVKRWTPERGFGFIRRANGGRDLFCHIRSLKDGIQSLEPGQNVEFSIQQTEKGEEARDVTIFDGETPRKQPSYSMPTTSTGERVTGTVRKWIPQKGYGFVQQDADGSDVFVHLRQLGEGVQSLEEGQKVEFEIATSEKGIMAQNVTICDDA